MSRDDEERLAELFREFRRTGRRSTRNELVDAHIGFANHVAKRFSNRGTPDEDLRQVALLGLVKAVDRYDPDYGAAFTSFAGRTIEGELKRHFRDAAWSVRVPRSTKETHLAVRRAGTELTQQLHRSPTALEVARHLEIDVDLVVEALAAGAAFSTTTLESGTDPDAAEDRSSRVAEDDAELESVPDRLLVDRLLESLPEREREIVRLRFFEQMSQSQIAEVVGVSQMHVSRLLRRSLELMRQLVDA